jgi:hypothetical protein
MIDPVSEEVMDNPVTCGEHTVDEKTMRDWITKCINEGKAVTNPCNGEEIEYNPAREFSKQFPRNLVVKK